MQEEPAPIGRAFPQVGPGQYPGYSALTPSAGTPFGHRLRIGY
jgi:hypothetical protein